MTHISQKSYASRKSAKAAAKRANVDAYVINENDEGRFVVTIPTTTKPPRVTKKRRVFDMCATGASVFDIAAALEISKVAARSLIGDLRRDGQVVEYDAETKTYNAKV